jgi:hypothetical protein
MTDGRVPVIPLSCRDSAVSLVSCPIDSGSVTAQARFASWFPPKSIELTWLFTHVTKRLVSLQLHGSNRFPRQYVHVLPPVRS